MTGRTLVSAMACLAAVLLAGCGEIRYPTYYALNIVPPSRPAADDVRRSVTVAVRRFDTSDYIRQGRIVYRETPEEIGFYDYHRWAADPGTAITTAMIDALRASRVFSLVVPYDGRREQQECVLSGRLERLDEVDYGGGVRVEARILAELVNQRTGETLWTGDASETSKIDTRTVGSVVDAMSHAVATSIERLVESMEQASPRDGEWRTPAPISKAPTTIDTRPIGEVRTE
jgi:uncharacterized lipoprotein YmbA